MISCRQSIAIDPHQRSWMISLVRSSRTLNKESGSEILICGREDPEGFPIGIRGHRDRQFSDPPTSILGSVINLLFSMD